MLQVARAQVTFDVSIDEIPGPQMPGLPAFSAYHDAIVGHVRAAGAEWGRSLLGQAVIPVRVALYPQADLPADSPQLLMDTPSTFRDRTGFVGSGNGFALVEFAPAWRVRTGQAVDGSAAPDVTIRIGEQYLKQTLHFDADPANRTEPVPADKTEAFGRFVHELGHALGFNGFYRGDGSYDPTGLRSTFDRYVTWDGAGASSFNGPLATALYGGPVPLTANARGHLGAERDPRLFGAAAAEVMNGETVYQGMRYTASELDARILCDIGVPCVQLAANAGPDRTVGAGTTVTLDAGRTATSGPTTFEWTQTGGPPVSLSGAASAAASFIAPGAGQTLTFQLTVTKETYATTDSVSITVASEPQRATGGRAIEYYNAALDHYFVTASADEIAKLDGGAFVGWTRTGASFRVLAPDTPGNAAVCRFFSARFAPKSSHFYTPFASECDDVKRNADWQYEGDVFAVALPDPAGNCAASLAPLFRLYNNGQGGAPNHRYTTQLAERSAMLARGWVAEGAGTLGVIACVPH